MGLMLDANELRDLCKKTGGGLGLPFRQQLEEAAGVSPP